MTARGRAPAFGYARYTAEPPRPRETCAYWGIVHGQRVLIHCFETMPGRGATAWPYPSVQNQDAILPCSIEPAQQLHWADCIDWSAQETEVRDSAPLRSETLELLAAAQQSSYSRQFTPEERQRMSELAVAREARKRSPLYQRRRQRWAAASAAAENGKTTETSSLPQNLKTTEISSAAENGKTTEISNRAEVQAELQRLAQEMSRLRQQWSETLEKLDSK